VVDRLEDRTVPSSNWVEQGPGPITGGLVEGLPTTAGAVEAIATDPHNADLVYVGAVNGGVWRTTNATAANPTWTPLTDLQLPGLAINSLAVSPVNPNTIYAGTGSVSSFSTFATNPGIGLAQSTDGGSTWQLLASDTLARQNIRSVVPTTLGGGGVVLVATQLAADPQFKLLSRDGGGVYRSTDGGAHFTRISGGAGTGLPDQAVSDLVADPSNPNRFYAAVPVPVSGAATGHEGVYRSEDGGLTWAPVNIGLAGLGTSLRILLAVHNSPGNDVLYADVIGTNGHLQGVFRTGDLGGTWASMGLPSIDLYENAQGGTHGAIVADPHDPNVVFVSGDGDAHSGGVVETGVMVRGDASQQNPWSSLLGNDCHGTAPHPDSRAMVFDADGNILQGDDGGVYRLAAPNDKNTRAWMDMNGNLATAEFHSVAYDPLSNVILGGTQDNGTPEQVAAGGTTWDNVQPVGDGGLVAVDADQAAHPGTSIRYSSYQYLDDFTRRTVDGNNVVVSTDPVKLQIVAGPGANKNLLHYDTGISFYQQFVLNAVDPRRMLIGTRNLYESFDRGDSLTNLGSAGAFVGGNDFFQLIAGRPMAYGGRLNGVAYPDVIYAGAGSGPDGPFPGSGARILHRAHLGDPLTALTAYPGDEVVALVVDPQDYRRVYASDTDNRVWASFDEGATWRELTANLPALNPYAFGTTLEIYSASPSPTEDVLLLGTLGGVFEMAHPDQPGAHWELLGSGLPHTLPIDIHYDYTDGVLLAGTLGRGAWTLDHPFAPVPVAAAALSPVTAAVPPASGSVAAAQADAILSAWVSPATPSGGTVWATTSSVGLGGFAPPGREDLTAMLPGNLGGQGQPSVFPPEIDPSPGEGHSSGDRAIQGGVGNGQPTAMFAPPSGPDDGLAFGGPPDRRQLR
jgi:hypothetical protein